VAENAAEQKSKSRKKGRKKAAAKAATNLAYIIRHTVIPPKAYFFEQELETP
jgi:hypothetical protein